MFNAVRFWSRAKAAVDVPDIIACFKKAGYKGYLSLEEFGPDGDEAKVRDQGDYLKKLIQG